jgi:hypothetical protein
MPTLLLIDDEYAEDVPHWAAFRDYFQSHHWRVYGCRSGAAALSQARATSDDEVYAVADQVFPFPGESGGEILWRLRDVLGEQLRGAVVWSRDATAQDTPEFACFRTEKRRAVGEEKDFYLHFTQPPAPGFQPGCQQETRRRFLAAADELAGYLLILACDLDMAAAGVDLNAPFEIHGVDKKAVIRPGKYADRLYDPADGAAQQLRSLAPRIGGNVSGGALDAVIKQVEMFCDRLDGGEPVSVAEADGFRQAFGQAALALEAVLARLESDV